VYSTGVRLPFWTRIILPPIYNTIQNTDISNFKIYLDISILTKINMSRREYDTLIVCDLISPEIASVVVSFPFGRRKLAGGFSLSRIFRILIGGGARGSTTHHPIKLISFQKTGT
jgi:hypothetical protein